LLVQLAGASYCPAVARFAVYIIRGAKQQSKKSKVQLSRYETRVRLAILRFFHHADEARSADMK
jgi:hypothetical protein